MLGLKVFVLKQAIAGRTSKNDKDAGRISKRRRVGRWEAALKVTELVASQRPAAHEFSYPREQGSAWRLGVVI
jgi:hypothetical protein